MKSSDEHDRYDDCIHDPHLKCTELRSCITCLRIENQIAKKWISYMNGVVVDNLAVLDLPIAETEVT
jgi:hypothetical protein